MTVAPGTEAVQRGGELTGGVPVGAAAGARFLERETEILTESLRLLPEDLEVLAEARRDPRLPQAHRHRLARQDEDDRDALPYGPLSAGERSLDWNGRDGSGRPSAAGVYFARVTVDNRSGGAMRFVLTR